VLGMPHLDGADQVVDHHRGEERGGSPVQRVQLMRRRGHGADAACRVREQVDGAPAQDRADDDRRDVGDSLGVVGRDARRRAQQLVCCI